MKVGKCPICGGETREAVVEIQETIKGRSSISMRKFQEMLCLALGDEG